MLLVALILIACQSDEDRLAELRLAESRAFAQELGASRRLDSISALMPAATGLSQDSIDILAAVQRAEMLDARNRYQLAQRDIRRLLEE
jgi:hypothetical protein